MAFPDIDIGRLCSAAQRGRLVLRRPREERLYMVRQLVGRHWSDEGTTKEVPCNLLGMYCSIVGRKLIANNPRVMLSTDFHAAKPVVSAMEKWANDEIERIHLSNTLQRVVLDALLSIGICKVGLATPADAASVGWNLRAGQPFAQRVDLDDFVFDVHARDFDEAAFIGHRYRVPLEVIRQSKMYSKGRLEMEASEDKIYNLEGDERIGVLGRTTLAGGDVQEFEDMVDLWEFYLPRHRLIVTLRDDDLLSASEPVRDKRYGKALRIQRWLGPDSGPYHILGFGTVPGNAMPKAPCQDLIDLHESVNRILRKLIRQADRQKEVVFVEGGADESGERLLQTSDGQACKVSQPDKLKQVLWGGPSAQNFQLFGALKDLFSWEAGGLELIGGLGPQSKTLGQDEMLDQSASSGVADMQEKAVRLTTSVINALCWYWHNDPYRIMRTTHSIAGMPEMSIVRHVHPAGQGGQGRLARDHRFEDLRVRVDPYSLQHQTPKQRLTDLNNLVTQVITPLMPLLQQQGISFDVNAYLQKVAKYMDSPDLPDMVTIVEPPQQEPGQSQPAGPSMPPTTTRNYNRRSTGGATTAGQDLERANAMRQGAQAPQPIMNGAR